MNEPPDPDPRIQPLLEWNRLARENAENAIVSSMFEATFQANEPVEAFSTWLLVGSAVVASFLIANAPKLAPIVGGGGFLVCGCLLCVSCLFGLISRLLALRGKIQIQTGAAVRKTFAEHLAKHAEQEKKIKENAQVWGITLETGIRLNRVLDEFFSPQPKWVRFLAQRHIRKYANNPQVGYLLVIKSLRHQGLTAILQALAFLAFLIAGFIYVAAN